MDTTRALLNPIIFKIDILNNIQSYHSFALEDSNFYLILGTILTAAFLRLTNLEAFNEVFTVFKSITLSSQLQRNRSASLNSVFIWLNLLFVVSLSLFYYQLAVPTSYAKQVGVQTLALSVSGGVVMFLLFRIGFQRIIASLFNLNKEVSQYIFNVMQINRIIGLFLMPANMLIMFINPHWQLYSILVTIAMLVSLIIYRYYLGYLIGKNRFKGSFFHFLLYICTLEIAPVAIVIKLIMQRL